MGTENLLEEICRYLLVQELKKSGGTMRLDRRHLSEFRFESLDNNRTVEMKIDPRNDDLLITLKYNNDISNLVEVQI